MNRLGDKVRNWFQERDIRINMDFAVDRVKASIPLFRSWVPKKNIRNRPRVKLAPVRTSIADKRHTTKDFWVKEGKDPIVGKARLKNEEGGAKVIKFGRDLIDKVGSSDYGFKPITCRDTRMEQKGTGNFKEMTIFTLGDPVLLRGIRTRILL